MRLRGPVDHSLVERSLREVVRRHEALRLEFPAVEGQPAPRLAADPAVPVPVADLSPLPSGQREALLGKLVEDLAHRVFDLARGPLVRAALIRTGHDRHTLVVSVHHIVSDVHSTRILLRDFFEFYYAAIEHRPTELPDLAGHYAAAAARLEAWRHGADHQRCLAYWRDRLDGLPATELPPDRPRTQDAPAEGAVYRRELGDALSARVQAFAPAEGVTVFMVLAAAFLTTLGRYLDEDDVAIGTPIATRADPASQHLVGPFINTLVLRADLTGRPTLRQVLARVRDTCLGAYAHHEIPFGDVVASLVPGGPPTRSPLFRILFQYLAEPVEDSHRSRLVAGVDRVAVNVTPFDLAVEIVESRSGASIEARYDTALYDRETIDRLITSWLAVVGQLVEHPDTPLRDAGIVSEADAAELARAARGPALPPGPRPLVPDLLVRRARAAPESVAIVHGDVRLTYAELDRRANRLARRLIRLGVRPEDRIGVYLERSADTFVAVQAVWKAGAAYVPLDLDSPAARLRIILDDAGAEVVLTHRALAGEIGGPALTVLCLDDIQDDDATAPVRATGPDRLAYVIYTSGSTGRPKGVMGTHGGLAAVYAAWNQTFRLEASTTAHLQMANFTFDGFLGEFVRGLCSGAKLVVCPREDLLRPEELLRLVRSEGVDLADFVPVVLRALLGHVRATGGGLGPLRVVIVGSDVFDTGDLAAIHALAEREIRVFNCYGVSEATIDSTCFSCAPEEDHGRIVLIGTPLPGMEAYVLDSDLNQVPPGVPGCLHVAGPTVTRGYLGDPARTAEAFVPHPFGAVAGQRLYRTGDLARYRRTPRGLAIEFLGRRDHQVKIRGYRVELGEVEAAARSVPGVRDAVVVADSARLRAFLVPAGGRWAIEPEDC
ncbi:amino acid adenylation domain-containing protein, partial [Amycolatopsis sp. NPDC000673]|uniref:non-ribosomal peptide synthetase n=1 Tax=Amycolatopsis sp. NPDC000673 TaxID=3154267 RepID=UPI003326C464